MNMEDLTKIQIKQQLPFIKPESKGISFPIINRKQYKKARKFFDANGIRTAMYKENDEDFLYIQTHLG